MDERLMLQWVDTVLKPWAQEAPDGIRPFVLLDSYRCHMTEQVKGAMDEVGVDYIHIPGGCTGLCQPVDVGINKPFKGRMVRKWEQFLIENRHQEDARGKLPSPSREVLSQWIIECLNSLGEQLARNAWNGPGYAYFNDNGVEMIEGVDDPFAGDDDDDDNALGDVMIFAA